MTPGGAPHILVVDDEPIIASLLADVLGAAGYRVTRAHRVDEALDAALSTDDFSLCVSDFLLPDRTGLDLARAMRSIRPGLRFILASAFLEDDVEATVRAEPSVAWVVRKPLDIFVLRDKVDELTGGAGVDSRRRSEEPGGLAGEASC